MIKSAIAVIGGGVSGLAAAYELTQRGMPFQLFEASDRLGGLVRTEHVDGFTIEAGADSMLAQKRAALALCEELGLASRLIPTRAPRTAFVLRKGRLHPLPSPSMFGIPATWRGLAAFELFTRRGRARIALEPLIPRRPPVDESIASFFRRRFGGESVTRLAQPLLGGIHAGDVESLSMRALVPRLAEAERDGSVWRWIGRATQRPDPNGAFRSLAGGMGELVSAIQSRLPADAVRIRTPVDAIASGLRVLTAHGAYDCRAVIIAAPAHAAARMLTTLDPDAAALCAQTRYVSTVSVALAFPRDAVRHPLTGTGFVVSRDPTDAGRVTACTWVTSKFAQRAPDGYVLLRAFLGGAHDRAAVDLSDDEIIAAALTELAPMLGIAGTPSLSRVYRWRNAGAQHDLEQARRVADLERRLRAHPGVFVTGSGFRTVGVPDCIADGRATAADAAAFVRL